MSYTNCYANSTSLYCNFRITSFSTSAVYCVTCDEPSLDMVVTESHMNGGSMYLALNALRLKRWLVWIYSNDPFSVLIPPVY